MKKRFSLHRFFAPTTVYDELANLDMDVTYNTIWGISEHIKELLRINNGCLNGVFPSSDNNIVIFRYPNSTEKFILLRFKMLTKTEGEKDCIDNLILATILYCCEKKKNGFNFNSAKDASVLPDLIKDYLKKESTNNITLSEGPRSECPPILESFYFYSDLPDYLLPKVKKTRL